MSLFYNNYQRLRQENDDEIAELSADSRNTILRLRNYISSFNISLFELEIIVKDLIGIGKEADIEAINIKQKMGIPEKDFCKELIKEEGVQHNNAGYWLILARNLLFYLSLVYTLAFCFYGFPAQYGITTSNIFFALIVCLLQQVAGDFVANRTIYYPSRKRKIIMLILGGLSIFCFIIYLFIGYHFIIIGNGWVILFILLSTAALLFFGNNYYWDQCSRKYKWK